MLLNMEYRDLMFWFRQAKRIQLEKEEMEIIKMRLAVNGDKKDIQNRFRQIKFERIKLNEDEELKGPIEYEKIREVEKKDKIITDIWPML